MRIGNNVDTSGKSLKFNFKLLRLHDTFYYVTNHQQKRVVKGFRFDKSNLHNTSGITPMRITSGGAHLRGSAPGQDSSKKTLQRWRVVGDTVFDLTGPGIEPTISGVKAMTLTATPRKLLICNRKFGKFHTTLLRTLLQLFFGGLKK